MARRYSDSEPDTSPSSSRRDRRRGKRVKFTDSEVDNTNNNPLRFRFDASSVPFEATKSTRRSEDAKTSEFAFFKKLKENAGEKLSSRSAHNEQINKSNKRRFRNASEDSVIKKAALILEKTNVVLNGSENSRSSLLVENATPVGSVLFNSQRGVGGAETPKNSVNAHMKKPRMTFDDLQQRYQDMQEYSHPFSPRDIQDENAEIFSKKRQKLHQWVKEISFPEVDGLNLKGHDIVFKLLSRLVPESKDNNNLRDQQFDQVKTDEESILALQPNSNLLCPKLQQINTRALMEHEFGPYLSDDIPYHQSNRLRGRILNVDAPNSHDNITNHCYRVWDSDSEFNRENQLRPTSSYANFAFPPTRFRSVEPVDEHVTICQPYGYSVGSSSNIPLLGWEFSDKKAEKNLSIGFQYIEPSTCPAPLMPWVTDGEFDGRGFLSLPPSNINKEPESPSPLIPSYNSHEYGMSVLEAQENKILASDNIQWAVSCRKHYFSPVKDLDSFNDTGFLNQDSWFISKIFNQGNRHSQIESLLPSELVLGLDWQRFPISSFPRDPHSASYHPIEFPSNQKLIQHCYEADEYENYQDNSCHKGTLTHFSGDPEGNIGVLDWSSSCFQVSLDRDNAFPLILDS